MDTTNIKNKKNSKLTKRNRMIAYAFLAPNFIGFLIFTLIPVIGSLGMSFLKWENINSFKFVGLKNYLQLFRDSGFKISFINTVIYTLGTVPLIMIFALGFAILLNKGVKGAKFIRAVHFFPYISSIVAVAVVWQLLYHPNLGPINQFLRFIGIHNPPKWTSSSQWALPAVMLMSVWKTAGYYMIIYLAGLQEIPAALYEAAEVDGANVWEKFRHITLPMLTPVTFYVAIMSIIASFQVFTQIFIMTGGGPGRSTSVLVYLIYQEAFVNFNFGYASAMSMVLFASIMLITLVQLKWQNKWVNYTT